MRQPPASLLALLLPLACGGPPDDRTRVTFPASSLGAEAELLRRQIARFEAGNPDVRVVFQQTPEDATQRHQLYVQRLNAAADDPDVLQLDVVWTAEFAAAGWLLPLDRFAPLREAFFPAAVAAATWRERLYALPWFVDVGLLYWRTDLLPAAPRTLREIVTLGARAQRAGAAYGIVWQGARYEGLVTVFLERLGAFGGAILDEEGRVVVHSPAGVAALAVLRDEIRRWRVAPEAVLTWHEEEVRFAFQNGRSAMMRNWPYAYAPLEGPDSRVAGRFAVATMPGTPEGRPTAALGGGLLAINSRSDEPAAASRLIAFLTEPEQMLERARVAGQLPARHALYDDSRLGAALAIPLAQARAAIEAATPRPVTPIWTQLSDILQIHLHRVLAGQAEPGPALRTAAREMERAVEETGVRRLHAEAAP